ncbi:MAG: hypothetical protein ABSH22_16660 [Tepidisphaeraceae bacterium]|jgi:hypothetical protein
MSADPNQNDNAANPADSASSPQPASPPVHRRSLIRRYFDWLLVCVGVNPGYHPWDPNSEPPERHARK